MDPSIPEPPVVTATQLCSDTDPPTCRRQWANSTLCYTLTRNKGKNKAHDCLPSLCELEHRPAFTHTQAQALTTEGHVGRTPLPPPTRGTEPLGRPSSSSAWGHFLPAQLKTPSMMGHRAAAGKLAFPGGDGVRPRALIRRSAESGARLFNRSVVHLKLLEQYIN